MAHPDLDPLGRKLARQAGEVAQQVVAQDLGALPVGGGLQPAISTWPATRRPVSVMVMLILPSDGIMGVRGPTSGSAMTAW
jgi:hypothetical protein